MSKQRKEFLWSAVVVGVFAAVYVMYAFAADRLDGFFASLDASTGITTVDLNASGSSTLQDGTTLGDGTAKDISILLDRDGAYDPYLKYVMASDGLMIYTGLAASSELDVVVGTTTRFTVDQVGTASTGVHTITGTFSATGGGAFNDTVVLQNATETGVAWRVSDLDPALPYAWMTFNGVLNWEGATGDDFQTTLTCTDPTADRAIVIPNLSGTWLLSNGVITSCDTIDTDSSGVALCGTDANTTYTAGDFLTLTATDFDLDAEVYTDTKCIWFEDPTADDDFQSIWTANGFAATLTKMWCESDQTVNLDLQVDDGTPADVDGTDLVCDATPPEDESLAGDATMADGDRLDLAVTSVSGTPTWVSVCWTWVKVD